MRDSRSRAATLAHSLLAVSVLASSACSRGEKPDAFVQAGLKAVGGQPRALWDALPPTYQKDANAVVAAFAAKVPEKPWNEAFATAAKVVKVLETKKTFVLGHPALQGGPVKPEDAGKAYDPAVRMLGALVHSDIKTVQGLKALDLGKFVEGPLAAALKEILTLAESVGSAVPGNGGAKLAELRGKLKDVKVTVESQADDKASVKIETPGEAPEVQEMVKVENKWLPKDLAAEWPTGVLAAKAAISTIEVDPAMIAQFDTMKAGIDPVLDGLLAADSQEAFNAQVEAAMKSFMGGPPREAPVPEEAVAEEAPPAEEKAKAKKKSRRGREE